MEEINREYWNWHKKYGLPVIARKNSYSTRRNEVVLVEKDSQVPRIIEILGIVAEKLEQLNENMETVKDIDIPIMSMMDKKNDEIISQLSEMRESMIISNKIILEKLSELEPVRIEPAKPIVVPVKVKEEDYPAILKDSHKMLAHLLISSVSRLDYSEIAEKLGMAKSSVRVYVSDMQKQAKGKKFW